MPIASTKPDHHAGDADLGTTPRQHSPTVDLELAEQDDDDEGDAGDERDQPGVFEEPAG